MNDKRKRIEKLEDKVGGGPCPVCGGGNGPPRYKLVWPADDEPDLEPKNCERCGRPLVIVLRWPDEPPRELDALESREE